MLGIKGCTQHSFLPIYISVFLAPLVHSIACSYSSQNRARKWRNQLQNGGGWCTRTIILPRGMIGLWTGGSFLEVFPPALLSERISQLFLDSQTICAQSEGVTARSRDILIKVFTHTESDLATRQAVCKMLCGSNAVLHCPLQDEQEKFWQTWLGWFLLSLPPVKSV